MPYRLQIIFHVLVYYTEPAGCKELIKKPDDILFSKILPAFSDKRSIIRFSLFIGE